ncbi:MAG: TIGR00725 family protein [Acidimicrobiales bacterium]
MVETAGSAPVVGVIGAGADGTPAVEATAEAVGRALAEAGAVLVCGGLGGVMAAACRGAVAAGGTTVGLLPGDDRRSANQWVTVPIATGLGELRNGLVVRAADALVAIGGEHGTLSEIALALELGRPVVGLGTWHLVRPDGAVDAAVVRVDDPEAAVDEALRLARSPHGGTGTRTSGGGG